MKLFQQKTEIIQFDNVDTFLKEFTFESSDYIIASRNIIMLILKNIIYLVKLLFIAIMEKGNQPTQC